MKIRYIVMFLVIGVFCVWMTTLYNKGKRTINIRNHYHELGDEVHAALEQYDSSLQIDTLYWVGSIIYEDRNLDSLKSILRNKREYRPSFKIKKARKGVCVYNVFEIVSKNKEYYLTIANKCSKISYKVDTICHIEAPLVLDPELKKTNIVFGDEMKVE